VGRLATTKRIAPRRSMSSVLCSRADSSCGRLLPASARACSMSASLTAGIPAAQAGCGIASMAAASRQQHNRVGITCLLTARLYLCTMPSSPESYASLLQSMDLLLDGTQCTQLGRWLALVEQAGRVMNLTGLRDPRDMAAELV